MKYTYEEQGGSVVISKERNREYNMQDVGVLLVLFVFFKLYAPISKFYLPG